MADKWWHGTQGETEYHVTGYQYENGLRVEGRPATYLVESDALTGLRIHVHPKGDEEGGRHFWVHNPLFGGIDNWLRAIRVAAARYGIQLEFDVEEPEDEWE